jgi:hypothetical protein
MIANSEILLLEDTLWLLISRIGMPIYDFDFRQWFHSRSPNMAPENITATARVGAVANYESFYNDCKNEGVTLVNSPAQQRRASQLQYWHPLIADLTPKSVCFKGRPTIEEVKAHFAWPVFMKGARQTSRHQRKLAIIESDEQFFEAIQLYARDPILNWQDVACREFVPLRSISQSEADDSKMPRSFEFRTFWWKGQLAGAGRYWWEGPPYNWNDNEQSTGIALAAEAARRVEVPFLVVDIAQTNKGQWVVIECNDGQESGYAGVSPFALWQKIIDLEKASLRK